MAPTFFSKDKNNKDNNYYHIDIDVDKKIFLLSLLIKLHLYAETV